MSVSWLDYDQRWGRGSLRRQYVDRGWRTHLDPGNLQERIVAGNSRGLSKTCDGQFPARTIAVTFSPMLRIRQEWETGAGHGQATLWISITTAIPISTSRMAWSPGLRAATSIVFSGGRSWPILRTRRAPLHRTSRDGMRSTNSSAPTVRGADTSAMFSTQTTGMGHSPTFQLWWAWTLSKTARAFALADFDHDGRLEVFLKNRNAPQLRLLQERDGRPAAFDCVSSSGHEKQP